MKLEGKLVSAKLDTAPQEFSCVRYELGIFIGGFIYFFRCTFACCLYGYYNFYEPLVICWKY